ncbi:MAG: efflux RND transporter periplasmic adaptor subunit, partial [Candidatus Binatia bacterium]
MIRRSLFVVLLFSSGLAAGVVLAPRFAREGDHVHESHAAAAVADDEIAFYRHPMRADVTSPVPAKDDMGMDYIPVRRSELEGESAIVAGRAAFTLSPERRQLIGVRTAKVEERDLATEIRAVGVVAYDPDLYRALTEYREALAARRELASSRSPEATRGADALVRAAGLRLRQLGLSETQIAATMRASGDASNLLLPGKTVWVYAKIYEFEAPLVKVGQGVEVTAPSAPGRRFAAKIEAIDPVLDPMTRTMRVRALLA